jgi:hypothetical protein
VAVAIVYLRPNESLPDDQDWVLVERDNSGAYASGGSAAHGRGVTFHVPTPAPEEEIEAAIERAVRWAEEHEVGTVYVREGDHDRI